MNNNHFDYLIQDIVIEELANSPSPRLSSSEAWEKVQQQLGQKNHWNPGNGEAFQRLIQMFHSLQGDTSPMFIKVADTPSNSETAPPSEEFSIVPGSEAVPTDMTLEDAQKTTPFPIMLPKEIPHRYKLENVTAMKNEIEEKSKDITLNYMDGQDKFFQIHQMTIGDQFGAGATYGTKHIEELSIGGHQATLAYFPEHGYSTLTWITQNYFISISGHLTKEEIIMVAKSMN
ncbi:DUF4367 domain-containing protein [Ammoniphilus resinae]|uniref:DUF4367 domain-containing protein n=1 Tax=Ammoniphilus resinae TaxID=861532 RepID=A0ABS4GP05_9BACL|nr:DUF4367 domain-containing protein [Ammoniphilus resinae]MBP1932009.1 hypothetical protein [Ammoniphilus resinae]